MHPSDEENLKTVLLHPLERRGIALLLDVFDECAPAWVKQIADSVGALVAYGEVFLDIEEGARLQEGLGG